MPFSYRPLLPYSGGIFLTKLNIGVSSSGKTQHFDCCIREFESRHPSQKKDLAFVKSFFNEIRSYGMSELCLRHMTERILFHIIQKISFIKAI